MIWSQMAWVGSGHWRTSIWTSDGFWGVRIELFPLPNSWAYPSRVWILVKLKGWVLNYLENVGRIRMNGGSIHIFCWRVSFRPSIDDVNVFHFHLLINGYLDNKNNLRPYIFFEYRHKNQSCYIGAGIEESRPFTITWCFWCTMFMCFELANWKYCF